MDFEALQRQAAAGSRELTILFGLAVAVVALFASVALTALGIATLFILADEFGTQLVINAELIVSVASISTAGTAAVVLWIQRSEQRRLIAGGGRSVALALDGRLTGRASTDLGERRVVNVVEEIALAAGIPTPSVYVLDGERGVNVFNAGWTPETTVIGVTQGALESFERAELQAAAAQAMAHVLHGDARTNLRLMSMITGVAAISILGEQLLESSKPRSGSIGRRRPFLPGLVAGWLIASAGIVGAWTAVGIQRSVARRDELRADVTALELTRDPDSLRDALRRVAGHDDRGRIRHRRRRTYSHLFFVDTRGKLQGAVHPDLRARILKIDPGFTGGPLAPKRDRSLRADEFGVSYAPTPTPAREPAAVLGDLAAPLTGALPGLLAAPVTIEAIHAERTSGELDTAATVPVNARAMVLVAAARTAGVTPQGLAYRLADAGPVEPGLVEAINHVGPEVVQSIDGEGLGQILARTGRRSLDGEAAAVARFRTVASHLVDALDRSDLGGWKSAHQLRLALERREPSGRPKALARSRGDYAVLVSFLAAVGGANATNAINVAGYASGLGQLTGRSTRSLDLERIDDALCALSGLADDEKSSALQGLAACANADHRVTFAEQDLIDAFACGLGVAPQRR